MTADLPVPPVPVDVDALTALAAKATKRAKDARRRLHAAFIATMSHTDKPYPDDERWTPWSRFLRPAMDGMDTATDDMLAFIADLVAEVVTLRAENAELRNDRTIWQGEALAAMGSEDATDELLVEARAERDSWRVRAEIAEATLSKLRVMHFQYLPAAVDYYCCGGCNAASSSYVPWPCPTVEALS